MVPAADGTALDLHSVLYSASQPWEDRERGILGLRASPCIANIGRDVGADGGTDLRGRAVEGSADRLFTPCRAEATAVATGKRSG